MSAHASKRKNVADEKEGTLGFAALIVTQFFGAANDNILKTILSFMVVADGIWPDKLGPGGHGWVSQCLTIPFILFSGYAGQVADRRSKAAIARWMKIIEVPIALTAGIGFITGNLTITLLALVALALQSTFFGPAKYGMIPELVAEKDLSRANGAINMFTNIAIIGGVVLGGVASDLYWPKIDPATGVQPDRLVWLPMLVLSLIAILGLIASIYIPKLKPQDPDAPFSWNPIETYVTSIREMKKTPLLAIACGWAFFYLLGMLGLLALIEYKTFLNIGAFQASILSAILAIAIGLGSAAAGFISGNQIRPKLVRFGAFGLTIFFFLLGIVTPNLLNISGDAYYWIVALMLIGLGFSAGFYIIPLQALLQDLAPADSRGRFLGTTNAISFVFISVANGIFLILRGPLNMPPNRVFLVCGVLSIFGIIFAITKLKAIRATLYEHVAKRQNQ